MVYKSGPTFLPFCHNTRVCQTDRRTDRILIAIPRLHCMQRGKNGKSYYDFDEHNHSPSNWTSHNGAEMINIRAQNLR